MDVKKVLAGIGIAMGALALASGAKSVVDIALWHRVDLPTQELVGHEELVVDVDGTVTIATRRPVGDIPGSIDVSMRASGGLLMPEPEISSTGRTLQITGHCPMRWLSSGECGVDLTVAVSEGQRVTVKSSSGDVHTTGALGALQVTLGSGSITVADAATAVGLSTSSGDIFVGGTRETVTAHSGSGRITVTGGGDVNASTSSGDVAVEATGAVTATSGSGRVGIQGATGRVTARSNSGDVTVIGTRGRSVGPVEASAGSGRVEVTGFSGDVTAHTSSGDVAVEAGGNVEATTGSGTVTVYAWEVGRPVALEISTGSGSTSTEAAVDPDADISVTIRSSSGDVTYAPPR